MWFPITDASLTFYDFGTSRNRLVHINKIKHVPLWTWKLRDPSFPTNIPLEAVVCWSLDGCRELGDGRRTPARTACRHPVSKERKALCALLVSLTLWTYHTWSLCWTLRFLDLQWCKHTLGTFSHLAFPVHIKSVKFSHIISLFHITAIPVIIARSYYCLTISKYTYLFDYWCELSNSLILLAFSYWHIFLWT